MLDTLFFVGCGEIREFREVKEIRENREIREISEIKEVRDVKEPESLPKVRKPSLNSLNSLNSFSSIQRRASPPYTPQMSYNNKGLCACTDLYRLLSRLRLAIYLRLPNSHALLNRHIHSILLGDAEGIVEALNVTQCSVHAVAAQ